MGYRRPTWDISSSISNSNLRCRILKLSKFQISLVQSDMRTNRTLCRCSKICEGQDGGMRIEEVLGVTQSSGFVDNNHVWGGAPAQTHCHLSKPTLRCAHCSFINLQLFIHSSICSYKKRGNWDMIDVRTSDAHNHHLQTLMRRLVEHPIIPSCVAKLWFKVRGQTWIED